MGPLSPQDPPRAEPDTRFATWLLATVLAPLTSDGGLEEQLRELDATGSAEQEWPRLACELDRVGWTLAVLAAVGEAGGELVWHHPAGLRWLLSWQWGNDVEAPDLTPAGGVTLAWRVAEHAFDVKSAPRFQKCESGWRIRFGAASPLEVPGDWVQD